MKRKLLILVCLLFAALMKCDNVYANDLPVAIVGLKDDPQAEREQQAAYDGYCSDAEEKIGAGFFEAPFLASLPTGYTHNAKFSNCTVLNGVDVSYYQGTIDWNAAKADGIEFAFIRVGYRGYASAGNLRDDPKYVQNIQGALAAGIKVGVYIYSQATTTAEAVAEADFLLSRIGGYNITFPVVLDFEYASVNGSVGGRLYDAHLSQRQATDVCIAFCERVASYGYTPMVYANKSMLRNNVYASEISSSYDIWLANYTYQTDYEGDYTVWQYTSSGDIKGISSRVDMNFWYDDSATVYDGVDYSAVYNYDYFISKYSDIYDYYVGKKADTLQYFVEHGIAEGRQGCSDFNVYAYKNRYVDLRNAFGSDLRSYYLHYIYSGKAENRDGLGQPELTGRVTVYNGVDYSAVFDFDYYIANNADLAVLCEDDVAALAHFVEHGMEEGRQGNEEFNVYTYRIRYGDLRSLYGNNLKEYYMHYVNYGKEEGRSGVGTAEQIPITTYGGVDYSAVYDYSYYVNNYEDVRSTYAGNDWSVLWQFVEYGMTEGRQANMEFNVFTYKNRYPDLRSAFGGDLKAYYMHYINTGKAEGRSGAGDATLTPQTMYEGIEYSSVYNYDYYLNTYPDVASSIGGDDEAVLRHFVEYGMKEGRQGSQEFNVYVYMERYEELQNAFRMNLPSYYMHYIYYGKAEGRSAIVDCMEDDVNYSEEVYKDVFNYESYMALNQDVVNVLGTDRNVLLKHFVEYGMSEGRQASEEFNVYAYMNHYEDLCEVFGFDLEKYYMHYIEYGKTEGRSGYEVSEELMETVMEDETLQNDTGVLEIDVEQEVGEAGEMYNNAE